MDDHKDEPPTRANGEAPIGMEAIAELRAEGENLLEDLIETFFVEMPALLQKLADALAEGDAQSARLAAHTLKGTGSNFGATRMHSLASALEDKSRAGAIGDADELLDELRAECDRVGKALKAER